MTDEITKEQKEAYDFYMKHRDMCLENMREVLTGGLWNDAGVINKIIAVIREQNRKYNTEIKDRRLPYNVDGFIAVFKEESLKVYKDNDKFLAALSYL